MFPIFQIFFVFFQKKIVFFQTKKSYFENLAYTVFFRFFSIFPKFVRKNHGIQDLVIPLFSDYAYDHMMTMTHCQDHILTEIIWFCGLKHHRVDIRDHVTRRDDNRTREDSATQLMEAGRLSFAIPHFFRTRPFKKCMDYEKCLDYELLLLIGKPKI